MKLDRNKVKAALRRLGYTKAAVDLDTWGMTTGAFLRAIGGTVKHDKQGRQVLWMNIGGTRWRNTVL